MNPLGISKRGFLKSVSLSTLLPFAFLNRPTLASISAASQRRIVLVELAGANDGLNTLVPYSNDHYYRLRPSIALPSEQTIHINSALAMHKSLRPLMPLWEAGQLAWVQGLGYPRANRSHFKSIALWETGGDGHSSRSDRGWMTHAIEHALARTVLDPHGISLAGDMSIFASDAGRWLSFGNINQVDSIEIPGPTAAASDHTSLALVQSRLGTLDNTLSRLSEKMKSAPKIARYGGGAFGEQLRQVATLIAAGVDTPVYRVRLDGFDTHQNQLGKHSRLMSTLANGLVSFSKTMKKMDEWQNTLIMSYSEFGRRAAENHSAGTDHGTAAPHLLIGGSVNGGLYSIAPDLGRLVDGDPVYTMDYRALYHQVLRDGLGASESRSTFNEFKDPRLRHLFDSI